MTSFRRIFLFCLLAVWLPMTSHCAVEAALGWAESEGCLVACSHESGGEAGHVSADACEVVENASFRPAGVVLALTAPNLTIHRCLGCIEAALLAEVIAEGVACESAWGPTPVWVPTWVFVRRAAPLSRAPSCLV